MTDSQAMRLLIFEWIAMRDWAAALLTDTLGLNSPHEILQSEHRGRKKIGETSWVYRTHGIGVDVVHKDGRGGIDFNFHCDLREKEFANPDWWRLLVFAERAIHAGNLSADVYSPLIEDEEAFRELANSTLNELEM